MKLSRVLTLLSVFCIFFVGITIVIYYLYVGSKASEWGQFGDFFGGVLNPFFSFLTLLVTVYIAFMLDQLEDKRSIEAVESDKRRFLNELRNSEYRRIVSQLSQILHLLADHPKLTNPPERKIALFKLRADFRLFIDTNSHLFPFLTEDVCTNLADSLEALYKLSEKDKMTQDELNDAYRVYGRSFKLFVNRVQKFIMDSM